MYERQSSSISLDNNIRFQYGNARSSARLSADSVDKCGTTVTQREIT